jgi:septum formation protein
MSRLCGHTTVETQQPMKKRRITQSPPPPFEIILASESPRRIEILRRAGLRFHLARHNTHERPPLPGERRSTYAARLALEKAQFVARGLSHNAIVLAADTIVCIHGHVLGKPGSAEEARHMLRLLSGRTHSVITGVALVDCLTSRSYRWAEHTQVTFARLTEKQISDYVRSGECFDKAGAYAIQGRAKRFVTGVEGCFFNVMGLPIHSLQKKLISIARQERTSAQKPVQPEKR